MSDENRWQIELLQRFGVYTFFRELVKGIQLFMVDHDSFKESLCLSLQKLIGSDDWVWSWIGDALVDSSGNIGWDQKWNQCDVSSILSAVSWDK